MHRKISSKSLSEADSISILVFFFLMLLSTMKYIWGAGMEVRRELTKIGPVLPSCRNLLMFFTRLKMKMLLGTVDFST